MIPQSSSATALQLDLSTMAVASLPDAQVRELQELTGAYLAQPVSERAETVLQNKELAEKV